MVGESLGGVLWQRTPRGAADADSNRLSNGLLSRASASGIRSGGGGRGEASHGSILEVSSYFREIDRSTA